MSSMWRLSKGIFEMSAAAQRGMVNQLNRSAQRQAPRGSRAAKRGVIGPWQKIASPRPGLASAAAERGPSAVGAFLHGGQADPQ
jgi:hypothetical protein